MPASDVYSWAKAKTKPSYSASEVGAAVNCALSNEDLNNITAPGYYRLIKHFINTKQRRKMYMPNNSMNGEIRQSIDNEDYYINIRTTADQVMYDNNISVKEKLAQMLDTINNISNNPDVVDKKIKEACNNLYIKIMGASDQSGLDEAYNTIKKISEYLINNQNVIDNLTEDVDDLKEDIQSAMHENKDVLDKLSASEDGKLLYDNKEIKITVKDQSDLKAALDKKADKTEIPTVSNDLTDELKKKYDDASDKMHDHENKDILDLLSVGKAGKLLYDGEEVGKHKCCCCCHSGSGSSGGDSGPTEWGTIIGVLNNQTDLKAALDKKDNLHNNRGVLDKLSDSNGKLFYNGNKVCEGGDSGPTEWGTIIGTLEDQTDLKAALDKKDNLHNNRGVLDKLSDSNGKLFYNGNKVCEGGGSSSNPTQNNNQDNAEYRILLSGSADNETKSDKINKNGGLRYNPKLGSLASGKNTITSGEGSHAEGGGTTASGDRSHAEGYNTYASGWCSHTEGYNTYASGEDSHAEGGNTRASGDYSHTEGYCTTASGTYCHAEGSGSKAFGKGTHAEGIRATASNESSHAEGYETYVYGQGAHAEGYQTYALGYGHTEGYQTSATYNSHAEGYKTCASGYYSHAEGEMSITRGNYSHAEGRSAANGAYSHAEGWGSAANGAYSHAEGWGSEASGDTSHAEGGHTYAGEKSHAEGYQTTASGECSHSEGFDTTASGDYCHAEGYGTCASGYCSHAGGHYNAAMITGVGVWDTTGTAFVIGNGPRESARSNAFSVQFNGTVAAMSTITASTTADYAEFFEWKDGNPNNEDRVGKFVTLDNDKILIATDPEDYILGIVSGRPFVLGNGDCDVWNGMYLTDDYNRYITEPAPKMELDKETGEYKQVLDEDGNPIYEGTRFKLNPDYDPSKPYVKRSDRKEWAAIGMLGVLSVDQDGTCEVNGYACCNKDGIATKCNRTDPGAYRVIAKISDSIIKVILK